MVSDFGPSQGRYLANKLIQALDPVGAWYFNAHRLFEAEFIWAQCATLARELHQRDPTRYASKLAPLLQNHSVCLHAQGRIAEACRAKEEAIASLDTVFSQNINSNRHRLVLAGMLRDYAVYLRKAQRAHESCVPAAEAVDWYRWLHDRSPDQYKSELAEALCGYGASMYGAGRFDDAAEAEDESVSLRRGLPLLDTIQYRAELSESLHMKSLSFVRIEPPTDHTRDTALAASTEAVKLRRELCRTDEKRYTPLLAISLQAHSMSLYASGDVDTACEAEEEAMILLQRLCDGGDEQYRSTLDDLQRAHSIHLVEAGREPDASFESETPTSSRQGESPVSLKSSPLRNMKRLGNNDRPSLLSKHRPTIIFSETWFRLLERWNTSSETQGFIEEHPTHDETTLKHQKNPHVGGFDGTFGD